MDDLHKLSRQGNKMNIEGREGGFNLDQQREQFEQRMNNKRKLFEAKYADDIATGETSWEELSPEEQSAVCESCGTIVDPEMPFDEGETILCGGDVCDEQV